MNNKPHVAIVGATGAVGREMLTCLEERNFPLSKITLLASARSAGKRLEFRGKELSVEELTPESFHGIDIALFFRWRQYFQGICAYGSKRWMYCDR